MAGACDAGEMEAAIIVFSHHFWQSSGEARVVRVSPELIAGWLFKGLDVEIRDVPMRQGGGATLKTLVRRIAIDDRDETLKSAARRIEHWSAVGLFGAAGVDIGPKAMGRGRVRRYPEEAVPWCLLWSALADRGLGIVAMGSVTQAICIKLKTKVAT